MIRPITPQDAPAVAVMVEKFVGLTQISGSLGFDGESSVSMLSMFGAHPALFGFVAEDEDGIFGFIIASITPFPWNQHRLVAQEMGWWVNPDRRGSTASVRLVAALEEEAWKRGAKAVLMICEHGIKHEAVSKLYERRGYSSLEHLYVKEVPSWQ